jgi:ribose transport system permease protein
LFQDIKRKFSSQNAVMFTINNKAFLLMIIMFFAATVAAPAFLTSRNLVTLMRQISVASIVSVGFTIIFTAAQFDMSVGDVLSLTAVLYAMLSKAIPEPVAILLSVLIGASCGLCNGALIKIFKLPAFVLTLALGLVYKGITHSITNGATVYGLPDIVNTIGQGSVWFIPIPFIIMVLVLAFMFILLNKTIYGRHVTATGGNGEAAKVSGIKIDFIRISVYVVCGAITGIGAVVLTGRLGAATPNIGADFTLDAVAAVVIGGTSMHGGKAKVFGTIYGVVLVAIIGNMLSLNGVSPFMQWIVKGAIIAAAIILDNQTEALMNKQRERAALKLTGQLKLS